MSNKKPRMFHGRPVRTSEDRKQMDPPFPPEPESEMDMKLIRGKNNCPILELTADGVQVGRCYYFCPGNVCPRHGDVRRELKRYLETALLTREDDRDH